MSVIPNKHPDYQEFPIISNFASCGDEEFDAELRIPGHFREYALQETQEIVYDANSYLIDWPR